jgi:ring-1,2-phenylacetyl-CoA epoxidase subunit PaaC
MTSWPTEHLVVLSIEHAMDYQSLSAQLLSFADDELLLGHRDSEWTGHAPLLEEDIAFSNLAQDELGHALIWYTILHEHLDQPAPDRLAFWRTASEFRNATFVELPKGDWAVTIVRQCLFDLYELVRNEALAHCGYAPIEEAVAKISREEIYHRLHSQGWMSRLGGATEESHHRMQAAVDQLWPHALGLFEPMLEAPDYSEGLPQLLSTWLERVTPVLTQATLTIPGECAPAYGGRSRRHTPHLTDLLIDLQKVAHTEAPEAIW